jgi:hypothetical protein
MALLAVMFLGVESSFEMCTSHEVIGTLIVELSIFIDMREALPTVDRNDVGCDYSKDQLHYKYKSS